MWRNFAMPSRCLPVATKIEADRWSKVRSFTTDKIGCLTVLSVWDLRNFRHQYKDLRFFVGLRVTCVKYLIINADKLCPTEISRANCASLKNLEKLIESLAVVALRHTHNRVGGLVRSWTHGEGKGKP